MKTRIPDSWQDDGAFDYSASAANAFKSFLLVLGFTLLTAVAAQVIILIPFNPVPATLQSLIVLLSGAFLGPWRGGISQLLYLLWGVLGLPLFAGATTGFAILAGPSGGYIIGFILAALYVGAVIRKAQGILGLATIFTIGSLLILFAGWLHMTIFYTHLHAGTAFKLGVISFLPGTAVKIILATGITHIAKRYLKFPGLQEQDKNNR